MPGILGAIVSMIYLCTLEGKGFPHDKFYFTTIDPAINDGKPIGNYQSQAFANLKALIVTICISIASGMTGGYICSIWIW